MQKKKKKYASLEEMYQEIYKLVYLFAQDNTKEWSVAEEAVFSVWEKILERREFYLEKEIEYLHNCVRLMIKNEVTEVYRKRKREEKLIERYVETLETSLTTEESYIHQESLNLLKEARKQLSDEEDFLLELRFDRGLSVKETGERMGLGISAVKMRQSRILLKLKRYMESGEI